MNRGRIAVPAISVMLAAAMMTRSWAEGFPAYRPPSLPFSQAQDGLTVSARPLADEDELDEYFGGDLLDDGILPVYVALENRSSDKSFIILKQNVGVALAPYAREDDVASPKVGSWVSTAGVGAVLLVPVASLVLLPLGVNMVSNAYEAKRNFAVKELQSHTLSPGGKATGFVYLKAPEGQKKVPEKIWLRVEALEPQRDVSTQLELPMSWAR